MLTSGRGRGCGTAVAGVLLALLTAVVGRAQQPAEAKIMAADAHPVFEVAAIKRSDPNDRNDGFHLDGRHLNIENQTVERMIVFAFGVNKRQIAGAPDWVSSERFDVDGVPDVEGQPNVKQAQGMVEKLLTDRFGLKVHREQRELPVYVVTVAKGGSKLKKSEGDPNGLPDQTGHNREGTRGMKFTNNTMSDFAMGMQFFLDRPVVDKTGLAGRWDFELNWTYDDSRLNEANAPPGLFTAVQEQLGLKIDAVKTLADVLVVDAVEKPTDN
jgi:uncharacterized protein (TIGR03435 family)